MTTFGQAIKICGLSRDEAAYFLDVSVSDIDSWCVGVAQPPIEIWGQLASLFGQILDGAFGGVEILERDGIDPRAFQRFQIDLVGNTIPTTDARDIAGTMALLMTLARRG